MTPESYVEAMRQQTKRIYAPSVMLRKALRTLRDTRSPGAPCSHGSPIRIIAVSPWQRDADTAGWDDPSVICQIRAGIAPSRVRLK